MIFRALLTFTVVSCYYWISLAAMATHLAVHPSSRTLHIGVLCLPFLALWAMVVGRVGVATIKARSVPGIAWIFGIPVTSMYVIFALRCFLSADCF
jgi:hypothetical protein